MATKEAADPYPVLKEWDEPVATAQQLADKMGYSRQHIDSQLRILRKTGPVESVKLGPTVGWYVDKTVEGLGDLLEPIDLTRNHISDCNICGTMIGDGNRMAVLMERSNKQWQYFDYACPEHLEHPNYIESMGCTNYTDEAEMVDLAVVVGTVNYTHNDQGRRFTVLEEPEIKTYVSKKRDPHSD